MNKIVVSAFRSNDIILEFSDNSIFDYSIEKFCEIINTITLNGYHVRALPNVGFNGDKLLIYFSKNFHE